MAQTQEQKFEAVYGKKPTINELKQFNKSYTGRVKLKKDLCDVIKTNVKSVFRFNRGKSKINKNL